MKFIMKFCIGGVFFILLLFFLFISKSYAVDTTWLDINGTNNYLDLGPTNILAGKTEFSVEFRVHFDNTTGYYTIIGQRTSDSNRTFVFQHWTGKLCIFLSGGNYGYINFTPDPSIWYHLAVVYKGSGSTNANKLKLYINGVEAVLIYSGNINSTSVATSPQANLVLGCEKNSSSHILQYLNGQFGGFAIWDHALTSDEINSHILDDVRGTESGLIEYFNFNNGIPNGNNSGITSFTGGKGLLTITPMNMALNSTGSNFISTPEGINPPIEVPNVPVRFWSILVAFLCICLWGLIRTFKKKINTATV